MSAPASLAEGPTGGKVPLRELVAMTDDDMRRHVAELVGRVEALAARIDTLTSRVAAGEKRHRAMSEEFGGTSPTNPGLGLRLDRLEREIGSAKRTFSMIVFGGGGVSAIALFVTLREIFAVLQGIAR